MLLKRLPAIQTENPWSTRLRKYELWHPKLQFLNLSDQISNGRSSGIIKTAQELTTNNHCDCSSIPYVDHAPNYRRPWRKPIKETRKKTNKQTNRTEQRGEREKGKQHSKPLKERSSEPHSGIRRVTSVFLFFGQNHNCHEQLESFTRCSRLALQRNFSLESMCKSIEAARTTGHGKDANRWLQRKAKEEGCTFYHIAKKLPQLPTNERVLNVF